MRTYVSVKTSGISENPSYTWKYDLLLEDVYHYHRLVLLSFWGTTEQYFLSLLDAKGNVSLENVVDTRSGGNSYSMELSGFLSLKTLFIDIP